MVINTHHNATPYRSVPISTSFDLSSISIGIFECTSHAAFPIGTNALPRLSDLYASMQMEWLECILPSQKVPAALTQIHPGERQSPPLVHRSPLLYHNYVFIL